MKDRKIPEEKNMEEEIVCNRWKDLAGDLRNNLQLSRNGWKKIHEPATRFKRRL